MRQIRNNDLPTLTMKKQRISHSSEVADNKVAEEWGNNNIYCSDIIVSDNAIYVVLVPNAYIVASKMLEVLQYSIIECGGH